MFAEKDIAHKLEGITGLRKILLNLWEIKRLKYYDFIKYVDFFIVELYPNAGWNIDMLSLNTGLKHDFVEAHSDWTWDYDVINLDRFFFRLDNEQKIINGNFK